MEAIDHEIAQYEDLEAEIAEEKGEPVDDSESNPNSLKEDGKSGYESIDINLDE